MGMVFQKNAIEAANMFKLLAKQGNCDAQYELGLLHPEMRCVEEDLTRPTKMQKLTIE